VLELVLEMLGKVGEGGEWVGGLGGVGVVFSEGYFY
jgi:hypothetical protein